MVNFEEEIKPIIEKLVDEMVKGTDCYLEWVDAREIDVKMLHRVTHLFLDNMAGDSCEPAMEMFKLGYELAVTRERAGVL